LISSTAQLVEGVSGTITSSSLELGLALAPTVLDEDEDCTATEPSLSRG